MSHLVRTTRKISSMELGKSESQPPVPNPTWPNTSRWRNESFEKAWELFLRPREGKRQRQQHATAGPHRDGKLTVRVGVCQPLKLYF